MMEIVSSIRQKFGERLRDLRLLKRLTQDEFAELLDVSPNFISSLERGINAPSFETLHTISLKLDMTLSELFDYPAEPGTRKRAKKPRRRTRKEAD
jgi:transcriptional regulator with XRE-family HTH domain